MNHASDDVTNPKTTIERTFLGLPYFTLGVLLTRHKFIENYTRLVEQNDRFVNLARAASGAMLISMFFIAVFGRTTLYSLAGVSPDGCTGGFYSNQTLGKLPPWPAMKRFPGIGCIFGYHCILIACNLFPLLLALPISKIPVLTQMGSRTLCAYVCISMFPALFAAAVKLFHLWGVAGDPVPNTWGCTLAILTSLAYTAITCSEWFGYCISPFAYPAWMLVFLDEHPSGKYTLHMGRFGEAPDARTGWRWSWWWFICFMGGALIVNGLTAWTAPIIPGDHPH